MYKVINNLIIYSNNIYIISLNNLFLSLHHSDHLSPLLFLFFVTLQAWLHIKQKCALEWNSQASSDGHTTAGPVLVFFCIIL